MLGSMDILPVLTQRFLNEDHDSFLDKNEIIPFPTTTADLWRQQQVSSPSTPINNDNTYKYLTDRWSQMDPDIIATSGEHYSYNELSTPMWISPSATPIQQQQKTTVPISPFSMAAVTLPSLTQFASSNPMPTFDVKDDDDDVLPHDQDCLLGDVPSIVYIRSKISNVFVDDENMVGIINHNNAADDDVVSLLADDPDEDDVAVLPYATYDVLANIFDEIYKDESQVNE